MNNCKFLQYPLLLGLHGTYKYEENRAIYSRLHIRYEYKPELMPPYRENDPIVIRDYGNGVVIVCSEGCLCQYIGCEIKI
jgi:hypothetical protein